MTKTRIAAAVLAALLPAAAAQAQTATPKPAPAATAKPAPAAPVAAPQGKALYSQSTFDLLLRERMAQGQPDSPELRAAVRDELNTRELLLREAKKKNLDKNPDLKQQMELAANSVLVRAYVTDWVRSNPIPEAELKREYDSIKTTIGDKEYKVAHILVERRTRRSRSSPICRKAASSTRSRRRAARTRAARIAAATSTGTHRRTS
jgi:hypothetical protein